MKVRIKNFRCYSDRTFVFDKSFSLILGKSGAGKTSVLEAIIFCLYGKMKNASSVFSSEQPMVEIFWNDIHIRRTKTTLVFKQEDSIFSDAVAQLKIDNLFGKKFLYYSQNNNTLFLELSPRDQLELIEEILFNEELDIKEIKAKFGAEKRSLDSVSKDILSKRELTMGFLSRIGDTANFSQHFEESVDIQELKYRKTFLQIRIFIWDTFLKRREELGREILSLEAKIAENQIFARQTIPYSKEQLKLHLKAEKNLQNLDWKKYLSQSVEDCSAEIETYEQDKKILEQARKVYTCPKCAEHLRMIDGKLIGTQVDLNLVDEILQGMEVSTIEEALEEIEQQISLYKDFKKKREIIDENKGHLLPAENIASMLKSLEKKESAEKDAELLQSLLDSKKTQLENIQIAADKNNVLSWKDHKQEIKEIEEILKNAELYHLKVKEEKISLEYKRQLVELEENLRLCDARKNGLARASSIFADTEQEYLNESMKLLVGKINDYAGKVFNEEIVANMSIESQANGSRKLKLSFFREGRQWAYDMFSGGEKARLNLCFLLSFANLQKYRLLLLDELTRFLDKEVVGAVVQLLRENFGGTIIASEHEPVENLSSQLV